VIPMGRLPVTPRMADFPVGVILETLELFQLAVYTLPAESMAIAWGHSPVVPKVEDTPAGVILVTVFEPSFAV